MDADQALRESEYRYRNLFQAMAASFWELDFTGVGALLRRLKGDGVRDYPAYFASHPDFVREMMRATRVLDVNEQTVTLFGAGKKSDLLTTVEPFWPEVSNHVFAASVVAAVGGKRNYAAETRLRRLDGSELDALFTACFPPDSIAKGILLIGVIDITERNRANERLRRLQAEFAHAARVSMLGELSASIAHEVNQPLAAIATNAAAGLRWLDRAEPDVAELRTLAANIAKDARRAADIIARVRTMATRREVEPVPVSLNDVVREAIAFLQHELQAQHVHASLDLAPDLPDVNGDRTQLQQVAVNLIMNGVQSISQSGAPRREISVATHADGRSIELSVQDSGPGIPDEHKPRLFQSFFSTKSGGMGMGLAISRTIAEGHGGSITAGNAPDGGARFVVRLPHTNV